MGGLQSYIKKNANWLGPPMVALGAGMWGIETLFRVNLLKSFSSDVLVFFEHALGSLILLPLLFWSGKNLFKISKRSLVWLLVSALLGSALGTVFFTYSLKQMNVSVANVLLNLQPIWSIFAAHLFLKEKIAKGFLPWAILAMISGAIVGVEGFDAGRFIVENPSGLIFVVGTIFCWGTATIAGRALMLETPLSVAAPLRFIFGTLGTLLIVVFNGHLGEMLGQTALVFEPGIFKEYMLLLWIAGMTPLFFYFFGLKYTSAVAGAFCEMSQTLFALVVTWGVLGHSLGLHQIIATAFLIVSVIKINVLQARSSSQ